MNLEKLKTPFSLLANAVAIAGLFFLVSELHQNTISVQASTKLGISNAFAELDGRVSSSRELADIIEKGKAGMKLLEPGERAMLMAYYSEYVSILTISRDMFEAEIVSETYWKNRIISARYQYRSSRAFSEILDDLSKSWLYPDVYDLITRPEITSSQL